MKSRSDNTISTPHEENNIRSNSNSPDQNETLSPPRRSSRSRSNSARRNRVTLTSSIENLRGSNIFPDFSNFPHPSAFSSQIKNPLTPNNLKSIPQNQNCNFPLVTPEKTKFSFTSNLRNRNETATKNKSVISFSSLAFATTDNKSKSPKKNNCYICRIKRPVKIVSNIIDIEDPDMLEKLEHSKEEVKQCACSSPDKECINCSSNSTRTKKFINSNGLSSNKKYISNFLGGGYSMWNAYDSTPNKVMPTFNTPGYGRENDGNKKEKDSDSKINLAK